MAAYSKRRSGTNSAGLWKRLRVEWCGHGGDGTWLVRLRTADSGDDRAAGDDIEHTPA